MSQRRSRKQKRSASFAVTESKPIAIRPEASPETLVWDTILPKPVGDDRVCPSVPVPETRVLPENFLYADGTRPNLSVLRSHLMREGLLAPDVVRRLLSEAYTIFKSERNLLEASAPVVIVGDLHGQFFDMLTIFDVCPPEAEQNTFVFLGDYVDRGNYSTEILLFLCACKINYPDRFLMLRGNHESRIMAENMTFSGEFLHKYTSPDLLRLVYNIFDALPIAARVRTTELGDFLCCHGGFSPDMESIADYNAINRFGEPPTSGPLSDILWADPVDEPPEDELDAATTAQWLDIDFLDNTSRMTSYLFGAASLTRFLEENHLTCIVRAHQVMEDGYRLHYFLQDVDVPPCITVFSAPNYCDIYHNKGSFMRLNPDSICFEQFDAVDHPTYLPLMQDGISFSLDALMEQLVEIVSELVLITKYTTDNIHEKQEDAVLAHKIDAMMQASKTRSSEYRRLAQIRKEFMQQKEKNDALFRRALALDRQNESKPATADAAQHAGPNGTAARVRRRAATLSSSAPDHKEIIKQYS